MARLKFAPETTPSRGPIPKPHYLPHAWTRSTYDADFQQVKVIPMIILHLLLSCALQSQK